jgi:hypothetical protein
MASESLSGTNPAISQFVEADPNFLKVSPFDRQPMAAPPSFSSGFQNSTSIPSACSRRTIVWNSCYGTINRFGPDVRSRLSRALSQEGFRGSLKGLTKYLYDRGFLVKKGTDEFRRIQALIGQQHYSNDALALFLMASEDCNFAVFTVPRTFQARCYPNPGESETGPRQDQTSQAPFH